MGEVSRRLGRPLMAWQQERADVAYEYDPDTGLLRYDEADITVPRQSGKTTLTLGKKVYRLTVLARLWGPQRSTYTAQTRLAARKKLERDFSEVLRASTAFTEVPTVKARPQKPTQWRLSLNNGSEHIQFGQGSFLQIDAPSRTGGHGDTLDDGTIDEAFAHEDDTVEGSMRPAMATRHNAQLWVLSTAGDAKSKYLWRKVLAGREAAKTGRHGRVCYTEYSAPDDADPGDPQTWLGCMPALHRPECPSGCVDHTTPLMFVQGEWERAQRKGQEGIDTFCRAYLNMWPDVPILDDKREDLFDLDEWRLCGDPESQIVGVPSFAVAMSPDRTLVALVAAGWRSDHRTHVEVVSYGRAGAWFVPEVARIVRAQGSDVVALHRGHPVRSLEPDLEAAGLRIAAVSGPEYNAGCGKFHDLVKSNDLRYPAPQPELDDAVDRATRKPSGDAWKWAGEGITALVAASQAIWLLNTNDGGGWMVSL